jgi:pimeloyl-ACP methyl ester carboxylesterase/DNA-binding CsgD family transcriptional regulator
MLAQTIWRGSMSIPVQEIRFCGSRDGTRIAYATCGSGPPLVWVPHWIHHLKFDWDSPVWRPWLSMLSQRNTLIRYDFRGCGLSDRDGVQFSSDKLREDFEAVLQAVGLNRFALFAMTAGARIVLPYVVQRPNQVTHLALYGTSACGPLANSPPQAQVVETETRLKAMELGWPKDVPGYSQFFASLHVPDASPGQMQSHNDLLRLTTSVDNALRLLRTFFALDAREFLPKIRCPTLVFHARQDAILPFEEGRIVATQIPGARFVPLETRNHILVEHEPAWAPFWSELDQFLSAQHDRKASTPSLIDGLTPREREILEIVARGLDNHAIASKLRISEKTVRNHVSTILSKIGAASRAQAVALARDAGLSG